MGSRISSWATAFLIVGFVIALDETRGDVLLRKDNYSLLFESADASFAPRVRGSDVCGVLFSGNPVHACAPLSSEQAGSSVYMCSPFVLLSRGNCSFDVKVQHAQAAGFSAVIISNDMEDTQLIAMAGNSTGISIPAVFVSKAAGKVLFQYANDRNTECWISPSFENNVWLIVAISSISLLAIGAAIAMCLIICQHRRRRSGSTRHRDSYVMRRRYALVKAMPSVAYRCKHDGNDAAEKCAICLEDYVDGAKLRILPCCHRFHSSCIDTWLTMWQTFCPVCKQDVWIVESPAVSENAPLLSSSGSSQQAAPQSIDSFVNEVPLRSNAAPIETLHASVSQLDYQGSTAEYISDFLESFRASPYFTPPSLSNNSAPNILGSSSPYMDSQYASPSHDVFLNPH